MKRRVLGLMLVLVMVFTSLTGCGEKVTAESLVDGAFSDFSYMECDMNMDLEMEISASGMTVDMAMAMNADMEMTKDVAHMVLAMDLDFMGMSESVETEIYTVTDKNTVTTYTYDEIYEQWAYAETELANASTQISADMFDELEMEKTDDGYVVTGKMTDIEGLLKNVNVNIDEDTFGEYIDMFKDVEILVTMTFDKDKVIEEMQMEFVIGEDDVFEIEDMGEIKISKIEASAKYENVNKDKKVEVPAEVIDEAVESGDLGELDDYEDDTVDEDEETVSSNPDLIPEEGVDGTNPATLENISFEINGTQFTLDTLTFDAIEALGYEVDSEYTIFANDYEYVSYNDENICSLYLYARNYSDTDLDYKECEIVGIEFSQDYEMNYEGGCHCDFSFMGLEAGATLAEIVEVLGTPDSYYEDGVYGYYDYYLDDNYDAELTICVDAEEGMVEFDVHGPLFD